MKKLNEIEHFRNGMFLAPSRTYGETYMEPIIRKICGLSKSSTSENDALNENNEGVEVKCSKVLQVKAKSKSLLERIIAESENDPLKRMVSFDDCLDENYDANIQNVKRDHFSELVYVLLFKDCIKIFKSNRDDISTIPNWSDKHGRYDAPGKSGQFNIKKKNISWHIQNNLVNTLTWDEVYKVAKEIS
jgi:hypothetical protein